MPKTASGKYFFQLMDQEFVWSIFENAAKSGHADKLIRPFPKDYLRSDGIRDFESLSKGKFNN